MQPLSGITVLDFSTLLPGPLATLMLAEAGARVVKVERPGGEEMRRFPPFFPGGAALYAMLNRGKEAVFIDLKTPQGRAAATELADEADILVEQFRPGVMERLGLGHAALSERNRRLVYCSITGYGQSGPRSAEAGHDLNYLARTGLLSQSWGGAERPVLPPAQIADIGGGSLPAVINILLALIHRERTGEGARLDIAMTDALFTFGLFAQAAGMAAGRFPANGKGPLCGGSPRYGIYVAGCGTPIAVAALEEHFWKRLCDTLAIPQEERRDLADPEGCRRALRLAFGRRTAAEWTPLLAAADCCATPLVDLEEAMADPHFTGRGLFGREVGDERGFIPAAVLPLDPQFRGVEARLPAPR
jgi:crotonobetainyl-CoA:carnitine CoA-transferase CaiB-like acyl-CoA transferase